MSKEEAKKWQRKILTGLTGYFDKNNNLTINPFCFKNNEYINKNFEEAKKIWPDILRYFIGIYITLHLDSKKLPSKKLVKDLIK